MSNQLAERPRAEARQVHELVRAANRGQLRVPSFQRGLRWDGTDVASLFDSIYRGYPIGSLLLWAGAPIPDGPTMLGSYEILNPTRDEVRWIVDGQQRVTSLALALTERGGLDPRFVVWFDSDNRVFRHSHRPESGWIPVHMLLDAASLGEFLLNWQEGTPDRRRAILEAGARVREFEIPAYVVKSEDDAPLREVFRRLNRQGKQLTEPEVFDALTTPDGRLESLSNVVDGLGWGKPSAEVLLRITLVDAGKTPTKSLGELTKPSSAGPIAPPIRVTAGLRDGLIRTIFFLRDDSDIQNIELLPYQFPLVVLPAFFNRHPRPSSRTLRLLRRWVWRSFFVDRPNNPTHIRRFAAAVAADVSEEEVVGRLLGLVPSKAPAEWVVASGVRALSSSAVVRVGMLGLASLGPMELGTGKLVNIGTMLQSGMSLVAQGSSGPWAETLANRLMMPHMARKDEKLLTRLLINDVTFAASHAVDSEAASALREGDLNVFFAARAAAIGRATNAQVSGHAEWGADDRPSLRSVRYA
jgi:hypothetical protein